MARLQSEVCTTCSYFWATNFLTKNAPKFPPIVLSLLFCGSEKNPAKFLPNFPPNFPVKNQKTFTNELLQERRENRGGGGCKGEGGAAAWNWHDLANWHSHMQLNEAFFYQKDVDFRPVRTAFSANWRSGVETVHTFASLGLSCPNPGSCAEKRKPDLTEPNMRVDHLSHKSGPNFFTENIARNSRKSRFFGPPKSLRSAVRTPICQIVPVSCVYGGLGQNLTRRTTPPTERSVRPLSEP